MTRSQHFILPLVAAAATMAVPARARADDGGWIIRIAAGYVAPTRQATYRGSETIDFSDPRFPPLGTIDLLRVDPVSALGDLGVGLELEHMVSETIGIRAVLDHTRLASETVLSGEATFTPSVGEPPALAPERSQTTAVTGGGTGRVHLTALTLGASFHVEQGDRLDIHLGPLVGLAVPESEFANGSMVLTFGFRSITALEGSRVNHPRLALGAAVGVDVRLGGQGWRLCAGARYLRTNGLNPVTLQLGLGYRF